MVCASFLDNFLHELALKFLVIRNKRFSLIRNSFQVSKINFNALRLITQYSKIAIILLCYSSGTGSGNNEPGNPVRGQEHERI